MRLPLRPGWLVLLASAGLPLLASAGLAGPLGAQDRPARPGFGPYAAILCHFSDEEPVTAADVYVDLMSGEDGLAAHFPEMSYGLMRWEGSGAFGWFELPHDRAHYAAENWSLRPQMLNDCFAAADPQVFYPEYAGLIVQVAHGYQDMIPRGASFQGPLDGEERWYGFVELRGEPASAFLLIHEIGHTLGLGHGEPLLSSRSIGPMNAGFGLHYVAPNKVHLGWMPEERIFTPPPATTTSIRLERMALPLGTGPIVARIPSRVAEGRYFMLEARAPIGADVRVVTPSVLLTRADSVASFLSFLAPDVALLWGFEEGGPPDDRLYGDSLEGLFVQVDSITDGGAGVTVTRGWPVEMTVEGEGRIEGFGEPCEGACRRVAAEAGARVTLTAQAGAGLELDRWLGDCSGRDACVVDLTNRRVVAARFLPPLQVATEDIAGALLGGQGLDASTAARLDGRGNDNGALDLGDLRAWIVSR